MMLITDHLLRPCIGFRECANRGIGALLRGSTATEACEETRREFDRWIEYWLARDMFVAAAFLWNRNSLITWG